MSIDILACAKPTLTYQMAGNSNRNKASKLSALKKDCFKSAVQDSSSPSNYLDSDVKHSSICERSSTKQFDHSRYVSVDDVSFNTGRMTLDDACEQEHRTGSRTRRRLGNSHLQIFNGDTLAAELSKANNEDGIGTVITIDSFNRVTRKLVPYSACTLCLL